jgi:hypothetical protein
VQDNDEQLRNVQGVQGSHAQRQRWQIWRGEIGMRSCAVVPTVFQWHTCVSKRRLKLMSSWTQEVRGGVILADQFGSVVSSQGSTTSSSSSPSSIAEQDHK